MVAMERGKEEKHASERGHWLQSISKMARRASRSRRKGASAGIHETPTRSEFGCAFLSNEACECARSAERHSILVQGMARSLDSQT